MRVVIYGAGENGRRFQKFLTEYYSETEIVAFLDRKPERANNYAGGLFSITVRLQI